MAVCVVLKTVLTDPIIFELPQIKQLQNFGMTF